MRDTKKPLPLPGDYDPQTHMPAKITENGVFHETRAGAALAERLAANGTVEDLALAEKVLDGVLGCQERRLGDPHQGNFTWMLEDDHIEDLNAVEFNLEHLIPMMLRHADHLSPSLQAQILDVIRLGLDEIRRLNVSLAYTNICLLDVLNTSLGGELLGERAIAERGYRKLAAWMAFTDAEGTAFEWNSPTYGAVDLRALKLLADLTQDRATCIRAHTAAARMGLSTALHIHAGTLRWAGPHGRAYHPSVVCETPPEVNLVRGWLADGTLPAWIADALASRPAAFEVGETAHAGREMGLTTYHSPSFVLGTASQEYTGQSDVLMAHYVRPGAERPGVLYTRYLTNDKWLGDFYHATDRTKSRNLIEEGQFYGIQHGPRAIGLYAPPRNPGAISSAKACLIFTERRLVDEVWVGEHRAESLPVDIEPGGTVVVGSGDALIAVRPLSRADLGRDAPIRLVEREGDLVLEIYNYLGPRKGFWELGWPGLFYKGRPWSGVYVEMGERAAWADGRAFGRAVASGELRDVAAPAFTYAGEGARPWTVEYTRNGQALGIEIDLMAWRLRQRWTEQGLLGWPMLESPIARQNDTGHVEVADAVLECGPEPAWLFASPTTGCYVAGYHGQQPAPLTLTVPGGRVYLPEIGVGTVVWNHGEITVEAIGVQGKPIVQLGEASSRMAQASGRYLVSAFKVVEVGDIDFGAERNEKGQVEPLRLDLYLPTEDPAPLRPAILWFHGGGFRPGNDKRQSYVRKLATEFAARGYVGIAPDYRVREDPASDWPGTVRDAMIDARSALDWVRANASAHRIDPNRIALAGGSAGGMIMHNLCHDPLAPLDGARDGVFAAVSLWGPPGPGVRLFERVNPRCPPTLFIHGTADALVPYRFSPDLLAELKAAGVDGALLSFPDAPHTPVMHMAQIIATIAEFLDDHS